MKLKLFIASVVLLCLSCQLHAEYPDFDSNSRVVTLPKVSVNKHELYKDVRLHLNSNGTWQILQALKDDGAESVAKYLPLLSDGQHISMITGFNAKQPSVTNSSMQQHWDAALAAGMKTGRIQFDWTELEPQPHQYDKQALEEALLAMQADGLQAFVLISTIDSEGYTLPLDLLDPETPGQLKNAMQLDNPLILQRFQALLDWVVPMIVAHNGWALSVGNEPGNYLQDKPAAFPAMVNFLKTVRQYAHSLHPALAITMTLAQLNMESGQHFYLDFIKHSDVVCFNYYAADTDFNFDDLAKVELEIEQMLSAAGDKLLIFQELGASAGYENQASPMQATLQKQARFFDVFFTKMQQEERIRMASVFQLVDWDPELVDRVYTQLFVSAGLPAEFITRFAESLQTTGLIRYTDGTARPAWEVVLQWIEKIKPEAGK